MRHGLFWDTGTASPWHRHAGTAPLICDQKREALSERERARASERERERERARARERASESERARERAREREKETFIIDLQATREIILP